MKHRWSRSGACGGVGVWAAFVAATLSLTGCSADDGTKLDAGVGDGAACACSLTVGAQGSPVTSASCFFGGHVPTLAEISPCSSSNPHDVQRVRTEFPACNQVVIGYGGYFRSARLVFDRTTGAFLTGSWSDDTLQGCRTPAVSATSCGEASDCVVCAEDAREPTPPPTCRRLNADGGVSGDASTDGG